jgi:hypothetical protein
VRLLNCFLVIVIGSLLSGCPPTLYCSVVNHTNRVVKVDFEYNGTGTLLPHFELIANASRRVSAQRHLVVIAHDLEGHFIGSLDLSKIDQHSRYYSYRTQTFSVAVQDDGVIPIPVLE